MTDAIKAVEADIAQAGRMAALCLGSGGLQKCMCAIFGLLEPHWRKVSTDPVVRCTDGNPLMSIIDLVTDYAVIWAEGELNNAFVDRVNMIIRTVVGWIPFIGNRAPQLPNICFPTRRVYPQRCGADLTQDEQKALTNCYDIVEGAENQCFFQRVVTICDNAETYNAYQAMFDTGYESPDDLRLVYDRAFADSYEDLDVFNSEVLFDAVRASEVQRNAQGFGELTDICSSNALRNAMTIERLIVSCIFASAQSFCQGHDTDKMEKFLNSVEWQIPKVRFQWDVAPPAPPPALASVWSVVIQEDAEGLEEMRRKMEEWFPEVRLIATSSVGSRIGRFAPGVLVATFTLHSCVYQ